MVALVADHHELAGLVGGDQQRAPSCRKQRGEVRRVGGPQRPGGIRLGNGRIRRQAVGGGAQGHASLHCTRTTDGAGRACFGVRNGPQTVAPSINAALAWLIVVGAFRVNGVMTKNPPNPTANSNFLRWRQSLRFRKANASQEITPFSFAQSDGIACNAGYPPLDLNGKVGNTNS